MAANIFKLEGNNIRDIFSSEHFLQAGVNGVYSNIIYRGNMLGSKEKKTLFFKDCKFINISFRSVDLNNVKFVGCRFEKCLFLSARLINCEFVACYFISTNMHKAIIKNCYLPPESFKDNFDLKVDTNIAIDLFQSVYRNSMETYQPRFAVESLYEMREAEYKHLNSRLKRERITKIQFLKKKTAMFFAKYLAGYGLRIGRIFGSFIGVVFLFSTINFFFRSAFFGCGNIKFIDSLYFTVITVSTLGYGDIIPTTSVGKLVISFEALIGFALLTFVLSGVISRATWSK